VKLERTDNTDAGIIGTVGVTVGSGTVARRRDGRRDS